MRFRFWLLLFVAGLMGIAHFQVTPDQLRSPCNLEVSWPAELDTVMPAALDEITGYTGQSWVRVADGGDIAVTVDTLPEHVLGQAGGSRIFEYMRDVDVVIDTEQADELYMTVLHELAHAIGYMFHSYDTDSMMHAYMYEDQRVTDADKAELAAIGARCYSWFIFD